MASSVFLLLLTATTSILVEWNRRSRQADFELASLNDASRAIQYITTDLRAAQYVYHRAWIQVIDARTGGEARSSGLGDPPAGGGATTVISLRHNTDTRALNGTYIPMVAEATPDLEGTAGVTTEVGRQFFPFDDAGNPRNPGAVRVLAMATDQPFGIRNLRYILYYLGAVTQTLVPDRRSNGTTRNLVTRPLFRMEGVADGQSNLGWYTMAQDITTPALSGFQIKVVNDNTTEIRTPQSIDGAGAVQWTSASGSLSTQADRRWKLVRLCEVVVGLQDDASLNPFTLRNPHPYANRSLISPYQATISLRVRRNDRRTMRWSAGKPLDLIEVSSRAFVGNVPMPQPPK